MEARDPNCLFVLHVWPVSGDTCFSQNERFGDDGGLVGDDDVVDCPIGLVDVDHGHVLEIDS